MSGQAGDERPDPPSPCVAVCLYDHERGMCQGCQRTLEEIQEWSRASQARKWEILEALDRRRADGEP